MGLETIGFARTSIAVRFGYPRRMHGRVLALDLGARRIGLAVSDPEQTLAFPAGHLERVGAQRDLEALQALADEREISRIVVGLPLHLDGGDGDAARSAREFAQALADQTFRDMGALSCWVSNAGGADDRVPRTFLEMPERQWDFQLNLNLKAVWTGAQAAGNIMKDNDGGSIINISSQAANRPSPYNGPYAVAKSGVNNLTQTLAAEMGPLGIRVNTVSPGPIPTEVFLEFTGMSEDDIPNMGKQFGVPLGRIGMPEDIAPACVYLASPASSWMTGQDITINGGL